MIIKSFNLLNLDTTNFSFFWKVCSAYAARVGDITLRQFWRALKTHLFGQWQLQRRLTVFFVCCVQICLLTYYLHYSAQLLAVGGSIHW